MHGNRFEAGGDDEMVVMAIDVVAAAAAAAAAAAGEGGRTGGRKGEAGTKEGRGVRMACSAARMDPLPRESNARDSSGTDSWAKKTRSGKPFT